MDSPCINVCALNDEDVCIGCFRTAQEITDWTVLSENEQKAVCVKAGERRKAHYGDLAL